MVGLFFVCLGGFVYLMERIDKRIIKDLRARSVHRSIDIISKNHGYIVLAETNK